MSILSGLITDLKSAIEKIEEHLGKEPVAPVANTVVVDPPEPVDPVDPAPIEPTEPVSPSRENVT